MPSSILTRDKGSPSTKSLSEKTADRAPMPGTGGVGAASAGFRIDTKARGSDTGLV